MFLKREPNPHDGGRLTRAVFMESPPGTRFAIDAETLHRQPHLLDAFGGHHRLWLRGLDIFVCLAGFAGVVTALFVGWWMAIWCLGVCTAMLAVNCKLAGTIARRAARRSADHFRQLHEIGCLWLVRG